MEILHIAVACRNASGMPDLPIFTVEVTPDEYEEGIHYDKAEALAEEEGYDGPFICFDPQEYAPLVSAARSLRLVPRVVVLDLTDGQVQSVRCDAGEITVICYDESDTDEYSEAVANRPLGENGQLIRCWASVQTAELDPGLKCARV